MLGQAPLKALLLLNVEPEFDAADPARPRRALARREHGRRADARSSAGVDVADVLLPIAPFTETAGTFVNAEGRVQSFHGVVKPLGETRPALEGAARARQPAGPAGLRVRDRPTRCAPKRSATPPTLPAAR